MVKTSKNQDLAAEHFSQIVEPAITDFLKDARAVIEASTSQSASEPEARLQLQRSVRVAVIELHHFADYVWAAKPSWVPRQDNDHKVREWLRDAVKQHGEAQFLDISLLGDVADAFKHARLKRRLDERLVIQHQDIEVRATGWGEGGWGEGPWGGAPSVIVKTMQHTRHLSAVILNVHRFWTRAINGDFHSED